MLEDFLLTLGDHVISALLQATQRALVDLLRDTFHLPLRDDPDLLVHVIDAVCTIEAAMDQQADQLSVADTLLLLRGCASSSER